MVPDQEDRQAEQGQPEHEPAELRVGQVRIDSVDQGIAEPREDGGRWQQDRVCTGRQAGHHQMRDQIAPRQDTDERAHSGRGLPRGPHGHQHVGGDGEQDGKDGERELDARARSFLEPQGHQGIPPPPSGPARSCRI
jgi:hypothetical protein